MAPGLFTLMRRNWKKSIFLVTGATVSLSLFHDYTLTNELMRYSCLQASKLGDEKLRPFSAHPRHVTVILNPVACKRKSKKLYSKWVEPLFHLAGIKVSLLETESPNQAYDLMKIMSNCDAVAIVGGDGTVHEALNGLLNRPDCTRAVQEFPLGILPAGQYNSIARYLHQSLQYRNQKEFLVKATMSIIYAVTEKHDVLKIRPLESEGLQKDEDSGEKSQGNPASQPDTIYALRDVRYGLHQDDFFKVSGYRWWQTYVKPLWLKVRRKIGSRHLWPQIESIEFTEPCEGCSRCLSRHMLTNPGSSAKKEATSAPANKRWWGVLSPVQANVKSPAVLEEERRLKEMANRDNPNCDKWHSVGQTSSISDFRACMMGDRQVRLSLGNDAEYKPSDVRETQDVRLKVAKNLDEARQLAKATQQESSKQDDSTDTSPNNQKDSNTVKFLIDGQPNQAHSIEISALHQAVTIYTGSKILTRETELLDAGQRPLRHLSSREFRGLPI